MTRLGVSEHQNLASDSFQRLVSLAANVKPENALQFCAGIEALSFVQSLGGYFHYHKSRIALNAVIRGSGKGRNSSKVFFPDALREVVNLATDVTGEVSTLEPLNKADGTDRARLELIRYLARLGQVQIAPVDFDHRIDVLRCIIINEILPAERCDDILDRVSMAGTLSQDSFREVLGIRLLNLGAVFLRCVKFVRNERVRFLDSLPVERCAEDLLPVLPIVVGRTAAEDYWLMSPLQLGGSPGDRDAFLNLFSRKISELRGLLRDFPIVFERGQEAYRILPTDRFPVVKCNFGRILVPDFVALSRSFSRVVDFSLMDAYRQRDELDFYNQVRGASLEIYIEELLADRLPAVVVIPERDYETSQGVKRSPDVTIIDPTDSRLMCVEIKARRLAASTSAEVRNEDLDNNFSGSLEALARLPGKVEDMSGYPEFSEYADLLASIPQDRRIYISVVPEMVFFQEELETQRVELVENHPLSQIRQPTCFMDLQQFEIAVELARLHDEPLGELLEQYYQDCKGCDFNTPSARRFRDRQRVGLSDSYVWKRFKPYQELVRATT